MNADGWNHLVAVAGRSRVDGEFARGHEQDDAQFLAWRQLRLVVLDDLERGGEHGLRCHFRVKAGVAHGPEESGDMLLQFVGLPRKRSDHLGDCGSQHDAGVINRQLGALVAG